MKPAFAYLLVALVLLQTFSRELVAVDFALNRRAITARYCVNKARPALHCNGKCYFAKKLKQQEERESKSAGPLKERLEMLPSAFGSLPPATLGRWASLVATYALPRPADVPTCSTWGIFHPPRG